MRIQIFMIFRQIRTKTKKNVTSKKKWKLLIPIIQLLDLMNMIETKKKGTFLIIDIEFRLHLYS